MMISHIVCNISKTYKQTQSWKADSTHHHIT